MDITQEIIRKIGKLNSRIDDCFANIMGITTNMRVVITANRTYYVRTDGSDSNSGLENTSSGAFITIQKAVNTITETLDMQAYQVTIQVADGTYNSAITLGAYVGEVSPIIQGNNGTPANVLISTTSSHCFENDGGGTWHVNDMEFRTTTSGHCLYAHNFGAIYFSNVRFGSCAQFQIYSQSNATVKATGNYAVTGSAQIHAAANAWIITAGMTITYSNTPNFSICNFLSGRGGVIECHVMTFTNSATVTGSRYLATLNGAIFTSGGGETYLPGNALGSTNSGGQYDVFEGRSRNTTQFDKNNATLSNITGITSSLLAGRTYKFRVILYTTSNVADGIKAAISGTCTATAIIYEALVIQTGVAVAPGTSRATALGTTVANVTAVTVATIIIEGTITVNVAGTLTAQFADNAGILTSSVLVGSNMIVEDITP